MALDFVLLGEDVGDDLGFGVGEALGVGVV
jgi:hypothetical protein